VGSTTGRVRITPDNFNDVVRVSPIYVKIGEMKTKETRAMGTNDSVNLKNFGLLTEKLTERKCPGSLRPFANEFDVSDNVKLRVVGFGDPSSSGLKEGARNSNYIVNHWTLIKDVVIASQNDSEPNTISPAMRKLIGGLAEFYSISAEPGSFKIDVTLNPSPIITLYPETSQSSKALLNWQIEFYLLNAEIDSKDPSSSEPSIIRGSLLIFQQGCSFNGQASLPQRSEEKDLTVEKVLAGQTKDGEGLRRRVTETATELQKNAFRLEGLIGKSGDSQTLLIVEKE
jgi:hypothetical protein